MKTIEVTEEGRPTAGEMPAKDPMMNRMPPK
jgi:hypothetical protein